jgi:hypothetical protein
MSEYIDIVFDGPPSHESGRFVEVESAEGKSISIGEWVHRPDGYWALRIASPAPPADAVERVAEAFYLAMYENDGGDWRAVETKDVWREKALRVIAALSAPRTAAQDAAAARIAELEKALRPSTAVGASLLRSVNEPLPPGCYCKPGQCMAPKIMGRQMPCRDPQKAALPADDATGR